MPARTIMHALASVSVLCSMGGILLVAGCATPVKTDYKAGVNFSHYRTFALMPLPQRGPDEDPGLMLRVAQPARDAVVSELTAKGLTQASENRADLMVSLKGRSLPRVEVSNYGYTYPVLTRYGAVTVVQDPRTTVSTYHERTLTIEIFDSRAKELVWVGWMKKDSSGPVTAEGLQQAIRQILAKFPPSPSG
jgi:hypothetical protein